MKKTNKGFTIVELVVVIAVVAVLAAVLIPTFTSIIKKANDSAYLQERQNQRIEDLAEKIDNAEWLSWEDVEKAIATAIAESEKTSADTLKSDIKTAVETALAGQTGGTGLKEEQVKQIVEKALEGQLTREQVDAIVVSALSKASVSSVTIAQVQQLVNQALASQPVAGLTLSQVQAAISTALSGQESSVTTAINNALAKYASENPTLTEDQITEIVEKVLEGQTPAGPVGIEVTQSNYATVFTESGSYYISEDILHVTAPFIIPEGLTITIDLNGHNISCEYTESDLDYAFEHESDSDFVGSVSTIWNKGNLIVTGEGNIGGPGGWFGIYNQGTLVLDGPVVRGGTVYMAEVGITVSLEAYANAGGTITADGYVDSKDGNVNIYSRAN